jgi:AcrR family transcriptional regulator
MSQHKPDRRIRRSKLALRDALFHLMIEKGYDDTSVQNIVERANVGRSTFYTHYADKEDLLQESLQGLRQFLESAAADHDARRPTHAALSFSLPMLQHVLQQRRLYQALAKTRSGPPVHEHLRVMLIDLVSDNLAKNGGFSEHPRALVAEFIVGSFLAVLAWWMNDPTQATPEHIDQHFRQLALAGLGTNG